MINKIPFLLLIIAMSCTNDPQSPHDTQTKYILKTSSTPENGGTITPSSGEYPQGEKIQIHAEPSSGYVFVQWSVGLSGTSNPDSLQMNGDKHVVAIFEEKTYTLHIETQGEGSVQEELIEQTKSDYPEGSRIRLTAKADDGWEFSRWGEDLDGEENPIEFVIEEETTVVAVFTKIENDGGDGGDGGGSDDPPPNMFTVSVSTEGEGLISLDPDEEEYEEGAEITAKANSDDGWKFSHWDGDLSGDKNPETFTIDKDTDITAVFEEKEPDEPEEYSIDISVKNEEGGSVDVDPDKGSYDEGEEVTVTANPDDGWEFVEWEGDFSGDENPLKFEIDEDKKITAVFQEKESDDPETKYYTLNRKVEGNGTVWWEPHSETDQIPEGTLLTIGANPADGWEFSHWEGDFQGSSNPIEDVEIDSDKSFTAVFLETKKFYESGAISHGYIQGVTPSDEPRFANRTYPVIQANWDGEGGDKRWTARNLGATDSPTHFDDQDPDRAGWIFRFNSEQGIYWKRVGTREDMFTPDYTPPQVDSGDPCSAALGGNWRVPTLEEWEALDDADVVEEMEFHHTGIVSISHKGIITWNKQQGGWWSSTEAPATDNPDTQYQSWAFFAQESNGEVQAGTGAEKRDSGLAVRCIEG